MNFPFLDIVLDFGPYSLVCSLNLMNPVNNVREGFGLGPFSFGIPDFVPGGLGDLREDNCGIGCLFRTFPGEKRILEVWVT